MTASAASLPPGLTRVELEEAISCFRKLRIGVIGDVMLDRFVTGSVDRISPEAPVPVVHVTEESFYPGGAANVARNLVSFAGRTLVCGVLGQDEAGDQLRRSLEEAGTATELLISVPGFPTTRKTRIVARQQQVVRIDREMPLSLVEEDRRRLLQGLEEEIGDLDALILEDYAKGLFDADLVGRILQLAQATGTPTTVDPHPDNPLEWAGATAVKPNRKEAFESAGVKDQRIGGSPLKDEPLLEVGRLLLDRWRTPHLLVTLGKDGMMLFEPGKNPHHIPTCAREVFDVSGAGDTAIALLTLGLASGGLGAVKAAEIANLASGVVVGKLGTASLDRKELMASHHS